MQPIYDVSIIIPVYNTERYLKECINSVLVQGLLNYEIIIVNDGSTDRSEQIILDYKKKYSFIKYIKQKNLGQGAARNQGIAKSKGKYIYFMDSDDKLKPNSLLNLYKIMDEKKLDLILFDGSTFYDSEMNIEHKMNFDYRRSLSYGLYESGEELMFNMMENKDFFVSPCLYLIKRSLFTDNNLRFETGIIHEDDIFTIELMLLSNRSMHIAKDYFLRRIRPNSTMTTKQFGRKFEGKYRVLKKLDKIYKDSNFKKKKDDLNFKKMVSSVYTILIELKYQNLTGLYEVEFDEIIKIAETYNYFNFLLWLKTKHFSKYKFVRKWKENLLDCL